MIQGYIPERFQHSFMGFPKKYPYEKIAQAIKEGNRITQLINRSNYKHKSRGGYLIKRLILEAVRAGKDVDYRYDGEDEYAVDIFNEHEAARAVFNLLKKKGLLKYV